MQQPFCCWTNSTEAPEQTWRHSAPPSQHPANGTQPAATAANGAPPEYLFSPSPKAHVRGSVRFLDPPAQPPLRFPASGATPLWGKNAATEPAWRANRTERPRHRWRANRPAAPTTAETLITNQKPFDSSFACTPTPTPTPTLAFRPVRGGEATPASPSSPPPLCASFDSPSLSCDSPHHRPPPPHLSGFSGLLKRNYGPAGARSSRRLASLAELQTPVAARDNRSVSRVCSKIVSMCIFGNGNVCSINVVSEQHKERRRSKPGRGSADAPLSIRSRHQAVFPVFPQTVYLG